MPAKIHAVAVPVITWTGSWRTPGNAGEALRRFGAGVLYPGQLVCTLHGCECVAGPPPVDHFQALLTNYGIGVDYPVLPAGRHTGKQQSITHVA